MQKHIAIFLIVIFAMPAHAFGEIDICPKMVSTQMTSLLGQDIKTIGEDQFLFRQQKKDTSIYSLMCMQGYFYNIPKGHENPMYANILWFFAKQGNKNIAYMVITTFFMSTQEAAIKLLTQILEEEPKVTTKDSVSFYTWQTNNVKTTLRFKRSSEGVKVFVKQHYKLSG